jgi:hypothetical protein
MRQMDNLSLLVHQCSPLSLCSSPCYLLCLLTQWLPIAECQRFRNLLFSLCLRRQQLVHRVQHPHPLTQHCWRNLGILPSLRCPQCFHQQRRQYRAAMNLPHSTNRSKSPTLHHQVLNPKLLAHPNNADPLTILNLWKPPAFQRCRRCSLLMPLTPPPRVQMLQTPKKQPH